jgi:hypothetical protein
MKPFQWVVLAGILAYSFYEIRKDRNNYDEIQKNKATTCGKIILHERIGFADRVTRYEYHVQGQRFEGIAGGDKRFAGCLETKSCIGLTFEVEYAVNNPANSMIVWSKPNCDNTKP